MNKYNSAQSEVVDVTPCWEDLITSLLHLGFDGYVWVQQLQRLVLGDEFPQRDRGPALAGHYTRWRCSNGSHSSII